MNPPRFFTAIFCDDIRREEGNKLSYLGVYEGMLGVPAFPAILPRLCFALSMTIAADAVPSQLRFCVYKNDEIITQSEIAQENLAAARSETLPPDKWRKFTAYFQLFPVQLTEPCFYRARAICDGEEFRGGSLEVVDQSTIVTRGQPPAAIQARG
jgi:hypothetical protein